MTDYKKWESWADCYDSEGDDTSLKIPLNSVSDQYLKNIDFSQVTAECGKPMTQDEFDKYRKSRGEAETVLVKPSGP